MPARISSPSSLTELPIARAQRTAAPEAFEANEEPIARGVHLPSAEANESVADARVVLVEQRMPALEIVHRYV
jgi:hypothetical protein